MTAKDKVTGLEKQAELIEVERNFRLCYVFADKKQGMKFDIIGYSADGSVLHQETNDESLPYQANATTNSAGE
ncbi:hypothetical protein [Bacillus sp. FJAT-26390]|uniref:hypothetical protein n=1 Tax=Bacillus sp. FJAT-26390 TaxID=1743142 RepID=UPI0011467C71|nr:hypothetical protein [Bacillus sp. FJAT-26390]